jgi:fructan beta-fructosidase
MKNTYDKSDLSFSKKVDLSKAILNANGQFRLDMTFKTSESFHVVLSNKVGQELVVGYDSESKQYYIDRTKAGKSDFNAEFAKKHLAPRISTDNRVKVSLIVDVASIELFADNGLTVMTDVFFPDEIINTLHIERDKSTKVSDLKVYTIKSIY